MTLTFFLLAIANLAGLALVYHKLSSALERSQKQNLAELANQFAQLEGLMSVHAELSNRRALPRSRGWAASPDFLAELIALAHERRPQVIIECSSGLSTLVLAACMRNMGGGHVYSLEHDESYAAKTRRLLEVHGLQAFATVIIAPLVPARFGGWSGRWYSLEVLPDALRAQLIVVDGPPQDSGPLARYPAVPALLGRLDADGLVVLDDADRNDEREAVNSWLREFPQLEEQSCAACEKGLAVLRLTRLGTANGLSG